MARATVSGVGQSAIGCIVLATYPSANCCRSRHTASPQTLAASGLSAIVTTMPSLQLPKKPLPPSVAKVFEDFLKRLENDETVGPDVAKRLREALVQNQEFDSETLDEAIVLPVKTSP